MQKYTTAKTKTIITKVLKDHKAIDVVSLNIKPLTDIADYMIIATANSTTHAKTLSEKICEKLLTVHRKPIGIEGADTREWMLVDFGDIIVNIMLAPIRKFYALEKLWEQDKPKKSKAGKTASA